jgi:hypothetical protein
MALPSFEERFRAYKKRERAEDAEGEEEDYDEVTDNDEKE